VENEKLPVLRAVIFDCSAVPTIDTSGLQALLDVKKTVNKHAARNVEYHFTNILNEQVQFSLLKAGFGILESSPHLEHRDSNIKEEAVIDNEENNLSSVISSVMPQKSFFHFTIEEAIAAAQISNNMLNVSKE